MIRISRVKILIPVILFLLMFLARKIGADNIVILVPYAGPVTNLYEDAENNISTEDTGFLAGIYFQMINPDRFQWNTFIYASPEVNDSRMVGIHFNFDTCFLKNHLGHFTAGTGLEYIYLDMIADDSFAPLEDFTMENNIFVNYFRAGHSFVFDGQNADFSVFPWAGVQYVLTWGSLEFVMDPPGPPPPSDISADIDEKEFYGIAGINLKLNLFHFMDLEAKYQGSFSTEEYFHGCSAMINIYFTKFMGFSYRFKFSDNTSGYELYHIFGLAFVFK